jgi:hypothetical protein
MRALLTIAFVCLVAADVSDVVPEQTEALVQEITIPEDEEHFLINNGEDWHQYDRRPSYEDDEQQARYDEGLHRLHELEDDKHIIDDTGIVSTDDLMRPESNFPAPVVVAQGMANLEVAMDKLGAPLPNHEDARKGGIFPNANEKPVTKLMLHTLVESSKAPHKKVSRKQRAANTDLINDALKQARHDIQERTPAHEIEVPRAPRESDGEVAASWLKSLDHGAEKEQNRLGGHETHSNIEYNSHAMLSPTTGHTAHIVAKKVPAKREPWDSRPSAAPATPAAPAKAPIDEKVAAALGNFVKVESKVQDARKQMKKHTPPQQKVFKMGTAASAVREGPAPAWKNKSNTKYKIKRTEAGKQMEPEKSGDGHPGDVVTPYGHAQDNSKQVFQMKSTVVPSKPPPQQKAPKVVAQAMSEVKQTKKTQKTKPGLLTPTQEKAFASAEKKTQQANEGDLTPAQEKAFAELEGYEKHDLAAQEKHDPVSPQPVVKQAAEKASTLVAGPCHDPAFHGTQDPAMPEGEGDPAFAHGCPPPPPAETPSPPEQDTGDGNSAGSQSIPMDYSKFDANGSGSGSGSGYVLVPPTPPPAPVAKEAVALSVKKFHTVTKQEQKEKGSKEDLDTKQQKAFDVMEGKTPAPEGKSTEQKKPWYQPRHRAVQQRLKTIKKVAKAELVNSGMHEKVADASKVEEGSKEDLDTKQQQAFDVMEGKTPAPEKVAEPSKVEEGSKEAEVDKLKRENEALKAQLKATATKSEGKSDKPPAWYHPSSVPAEHKVHEKVHENGKLDPSQQKAWEQMQQIEEAKEAKKGGA